MSEREPDIQDDPRRQGTGEGYPESENEEQTPVEGTDQGPEAGTGGDSGPDTQAGQDDDPGAATGNPGAAG
jgi:hypothetical protein